MYTFSTMPIVAAVDVGRSVIKDRLRTSGTVCELDQKDHRRHQRRINDDITDACLAPATTTDDNYAKTYALTVHAPGISERRRLVWFTRLTHLRNIVLQHRFAKTAIEAKTAACVIVHRTNFP